MLDKLPDEILFLIFSKLDIKSMIAFKLTCKRFYDIVEKIHSNPYLLSKYQRYNHLTALLDLFPDESWNYNVLSYNPSMTWEYAKNSPKILNSELFGKNPNITWDILQSNGQIKKNYREISENPNITIDIVLQNPTIEWCFEELSANPSITFKDIQANPDKPWSYSYMSWNPNITIDDINSVEFTEEDEENDECWDFKILSMNPNITIDIFLKYFTEDYSIRFLSENSNITIDIVKQYAENNKFGNPEICWNMYGLSRNPNINMKIVLENPDIEWNFNELSCNPNITIDDILNNPDKPWNYEYVVENPNLTWKQAGQFEQIFNFRFKDEYITKFYKMSRCPFNKKPFSI